MAPWLTKLLGTLTGDGFIEQIMSRVKMPLEKKAEFAAAIREAAMEQEDNFRDWVLDFSGKATDLTKGMLWLRSTVRPVITYGAFGALVWTHVYTFLHLGALSVEALAAINIMQGQLYKLNLVTLIFWFGDKALQRSGLLEVLGSRKKDDK